VYAEHQPLTFPPISPYTVPPESMPIETNEHVRGICIWFVRSNANVKGRPNIKASDFKKWVNTFLIPTHCPALHGLRESA